MGSGGKRPDALLESRAAAPAPAPLLAVPPPSVDRGTGSARRAMTRDTTTLAEAERTASTARSGCSPWERRTTAPAHRLELMRCATSSGTLRARGRENGTTV